MLRSDLTFVIKTALLYCTLAFSFSIIGIFLPDRVHQVNPLHSFTAEEVLGHISWGLLVGAVTMRLRYFLLAGFFAVLVDSDHLIGLLHVETISRMSHSIAFGIISAIAVMSFFGKRDYLLGATAIGGLLAHLSFDEFRGNDSKFPIFTPLYDHMISFPHTDWIFLEIAAIAVIGLTSLLVIRKPEKTI